jgi:hypothetical protein
VGFYIVVFIGFWVLFSTAISNIDLVARQATDMLWFASDRARKWAKLDIRRIYYILLLAIVIWGSLYMNITVPLLVLAFSANIANFTMALSSLLTIIVNRKFLPKEAQPAMWREVIMIVVMLFFGFFFSLFILSQFFGVKL